MAVDFILLAEHIRLYHSGRINAITARDLRQFGTPRDIRHLVNAARKDGFRICSGNSGYFYSKNPEDLNHTINRLESQIREQLEIVQALKKSKWG